MRRGLLLGGIVVLVALAGAMLAFLQPVPDAPRITGREAGAAFLGLLLLVALVLGPDWRDWF